VAIQNATTTRRGWETTMIKTVLITSSIGMVVGFAGSLLSMFGNGSFKMELVEFAVMVLLFLVMLVGAYWFVMVEYGNPSSDRK
jgi:cation transporter-like permease